MSGKRVVVIGGGQDARGVDDPPPGNGRASCLLFAREGASVVCVDRFQAAAEATARLVQGEGGTATALQANVTDPAQIDRAIADAVMRLGGLDAVLINVGVAQGEPWLAGIDPDRWNAVFDINVRAHALVARAAMPVMSGGGAFVFVSSVAGQEPGSRLVSYDSSKAALDGLVRHVAWEGEQRAIRANIVAPGFIDTANGRRATQFRPERAEQRLPFGRQGTAWEVAQACLFMLSDEASYINAQTLTVDGGHGALHAALGLPGQPPRSEERPA